MFSLKKYIHTKMDNYIINKKKYLREELKTLMEAKKHMQSSSVKYNKYGVGSYRTQKYSTSIIESQRDTIIKTINKLDELEVLNNKLVGK